MKRFQILLFKGYRRLKNKGYYGLKRMRITFFINYRGLRTDIPIFVKWIIYYALSSRFRYIVRNPIFVVGCGHSGTTLLLRVIGTHPNIQAILDESYIFCPETYQFTCQQAYFPNLCMSLSKKFRLAQFDISAFNSDRKRWVEKTPRHIHHIEDILRYRPNSRILLIIRDGRDVAASMKRMTGDFESSVKRWTYNNKAGESWWNHKQVFVVRYESIVEKFNETVTSVMNFLAEEFSEQCYQFNLLYTDREEALSEAGPESRENIVTLRKWQVQQSLYDGRGKWFNEMTPEEKRLFKTMAGEMLIEYGYSEDNTW